MFPVVDKCNVCDIGKNEFRPDANSFRKYIPYFLEDIPNEACAKSGRPSYLDVRLILLLFTSQCILFLVSETVNVLHNTVHLI